MVIASDWGDPVSPTLRTRAAWVQAGLVLALLAGDAAVLAHRQGPAVPRSVALAQGQAETGEEAEKRASERDEAIRALFDARARAVRARDRAAFMAGVDPSQADFVKDQNEVFDNLLKLDFADWTYTTRADESYSVTSIDHEKYEDADDIWLPVLVLHYQLKGFDERPVGRRVVYTVVRRGDRWLVASDSDLEKSTSIGTSVRVEPWENGPITVERTKNVLVIGHPEDAKAVRGIVREATAAIKHVGKFVGRSWGEKVVIMLPGDHDELNRLLEDPDVPFDFGAIARPLPTNPDDDDFQQFAGSRVVINPDGFRIGNTFAKMLIRHEITHIAMFERTGPLTPKWLIEGLAEYVGNAGQPYSAARLAPTLGDLVDTKGVPNFLPSDSDFGLINDAGVGYDSGWLLCRYIAAKHGEKALLKLYVETGKLDGSGSQDAAVQKVMRRVLKTDEKSLLRAWRPYVRAAVADLTKLLVKPGGAYKEDDLSETDTSGLAYIYDVKQSALDAMGVERGAVGIWNVGDEDKPRKRYVVTMGIARDEKAAAAYEQVVRRRYTPFDPTGRPIPNGRMYFVGSSIGGQHYNDTVAVIRVGIVVFEVGVSVPGFGDASGETQTLANKQYAAID